MLTDDRPKGKTPIHVCKGETVTEAAERARLTTALPADLQEIEKRYADIHERALASEMQWEDAETLHDDCAALLSHIKATQWSEEELEMFIRRYFNENIAAPIRFLNDTSPSHLARAILGSRSDG